MREKEEERRIVLSPGEAIQSLFTNVFEVINNEIRIAIQRQGEREWGDLYKRGMVSNILKVGFNWHICIVLCVHTTNSMNYI